MHSVNTGTGHDAVHAYIVCIIGPLVKLGAVRVLQCNEYGLVIIQKRTSLLWIHIVCRQEAANVLRLLLGPQSLH